MGTIRKLLRRLTEWGHRPASEPTLDRTPADGSVEIAAVSGVRAVENSRDPRFRAFESLEAGPETVAPGWQRSRHRPPLLGRVVVFSFFVGRDGGAWTDSEIAHASKAVARSGEWIEREAMRWGAPVNIALADTYFRADDDVSEEVILSIVAQEHEDGLFEERAVTKALASASRAAAKLGFTDVAGLMDQIAGRVEADHRVWLLQLRRAGRSMAVAADTAPIPGVAVAVCYAREENFPEPLVDSPFPDPVTFAHEILHLFGASDKYGVPLSRFPRHSVTERDVMRLDTESLSRLRIDLGTAIELGWAVAGQKPKNDDARRAR